MKSFMEELINRKFELNDEVLNIKTLLHQDHSDSLYRAISAKFKKWKHRSNYITLDQFMDKMKINSIFTKATESNVSLDEFVYFAECIINLIFIVKQTDLYIIAKENRTAIFENLMNVLNQINFSVKYFETEQFYRVIEKDWKITESAEIIKNEYDLG